MQILSLLLPARLGAQEATQRCADVPRQAKVAIGNFDGVHLGHRRVLSDCDTVLTFDPHPLRVLESSPAPDLLSDSCEKFRKFRALGIRRVALVSFDRSWARVTAEEFIEHVVLRQLDAGFVSIGEGFRFGAGGGGTAATFERYAGLLTRVVPLVTHGAAAEVISSTRIRRLVVDGDVEEAARLLGAPLTLPAEKHHGHTLVIPEEFVQPAPGLYRGRADTQRCMLRTHAHGTVEVLGVAHLGTRPELAFLARVS